MKFAIRVSEKRIPKENLGKVEFTLPESQLWTCMVHTHGQLPETRKPQARERKRGEWKIRAEIAIKRFLVTVRAKLQESLSRRSIKDGRRGAIATCCEQTKHSQKQGNLIMIKNSNSESLHLGYCSLQSQNRCNGQAIYTRNIVRSLNFWNFSFAFSRPKIRYAAGS